MLKIKNKYIFDEKEVQKIYSALTIGEVAIAGAASKLQESTLKTYYEVSEKTLIEAKEIISKTS